MTDKSIIKIRRKSNIKAGDRFGRWTVIKKVASDKYGLPMWLCACECGTSRNVIGNHLHNGCSKSCGCLRKDLLVRHKMCETSEYITWAHMIQRCTNSKDKAYHNYGGRGITVCKEWLNFANFYNDMGKRPKGLTLERIDNDGNYEPHNCRWDSRTAQCRNRRTHSNNIVGITGIYWHKTNQRYCVSIGVCGKQRHIGSFKILEQAFEARKQAEKQYWGK